MSAIETIGESSAVTGAAFWTLSVAAVCVALWIQRTIQGVRDEVGKIAKEMALLSVKVDGYVKRDEFRRWAYSVAALNPNLTMPEDLP